MATAPLTSRRSGVPSQLLLERTASAAAAHGHTSPKVADVESVHVEVAGLQAPLLGDDGALPCGNSVRMRRAGQVAGLLLALAALFALHLSFKQGPHNVLHQALRSVHTATWQHRRPVTTSVPLTDDPLGTGGGGALDAAASSVAGASTLMAAALGGADAGPDEDDIGPRAAPSVASLGGGTEDLTFEEITANPVAEGVVATGRRDSPAAAGPALPLLWSEVAGGLDAEESHLDDALAAQQALQDQQQQPFTGLRWSGAEVLAAGSQPISKLSDYDRSFELKFPKGSFPSPVVARYYVYDVASVATDPRVAPFLARVVSELRGGMRLAAYSQMAVHVELDAASLPALAAQAAMFLDASPTGARMKFPANSVACLLFGRMGLQGTDGPDGDDDVDDLQQQDPRQQQESGGLAQEATAASSDDASALGAGGSVGAVAAAATKQLQQSSAQAQGLTWGQCAEVSEAGEDYADDMMVAVISAEVPPSAFVARGGGMLDLDMVVMVMTSYGVPAEEMFAHAATAA